MSGAFYTEVLSPVGNPAMLEAAVRSGADAVYLGAKEFSARRNAENFSTDELKKAVEYCHIRNVKVYLTLNIIIKDSEMSSAVKLAETAYNCGVDGIIVEDLGLCSVIRRLLPDFPLHASTQMSVHSVSALSELKKLGFCRVVAAREMSFEELKIFCKEAQRLGLEVEVFVHGALCMSVSGQCLLSAFLGSRSGNRGLCAGPCRLAFSVPGGTGHDLSLKDLSLLSHMRKLCDIGVTSFKIEGRMKRPEYVAAATAACRSALDSGFVPEELEVTLKNVFSRSGFTDGYFENKLGRDMFGVRTKEDVTAANSAFPKLHELYRSERRSIKIRAELTVKSGCPIRLVLDDGKNRAEVTGETPQKAVNKAADGESLRNGIDKFGSTPYFAEEIKVFCDGGLFVSASALNDLRRQATELLDKKRGEVPVRQIETVYSPFPPEKKRSVKAKLYARFEDVSQIPADLCGIDMLIFPLEKEFNISVSGIRLAVDVPRGIINEDNIKKRLRTFKEKGFKTALCGNISALKIAKDEGFEIIAHTGMNIYNSESASAVGEMGAKEVILSNEIMLNDAAALFSPIPKGIIAYGNIPLMLFKNCPLKNGKKCEKCDKKGVITDRTGTDFPVRCRMGYGEMLNSVPIWLADKKQDLKAVDFAVLYFTNESPERVKQVINAYKNGISADVKFTRGLFYRGSI